MKSAILEVSQSKKVKGRTHIKWVVHEIYDTTEKYNDNGISWYEEYVRNNIDTIKGMPIAVEFLDWDKSEPWGHGESGVKDGNPLFESSVVVGVAEEGYIDTVEINGESKKVLIASGYIYNQRYPSFVQWLKSEMYDNKHPDTSVEICAKDGNDVIQYRDGWKEKGRIPMIFDYTGSAILGVTPADESAVVLELNNKFLKRKGDQKMAENNKDQVVIELNNKLDDKNKEINTLQNDVKSKDSKISELNQMVEGKTNEVNALTDELKETKETLSSKEKEVTDLTNEINELRQFKQEAENKQLVTELNSKLASYTDEEKEAVKDKVEAFQKEPSKDGIQTIVNEINSSIAQKLIEARQEKQKKEQNSKTEDIYGDISETNSEDVTIEDIY